MNLMEEMWISKPQRRITKLSDLSDGVIARIKFYNANKEYTVENFKMIFLNIRGLYTAIKKL